MLSVIRVRAVQVAAVAVVLAGLITVLCATWAAIKTGHAMILAAHSHHVAALAGGAIVATRRMKFRNLRVGDELTGQRIVTEIYHDDDGLWVGTDDDDAGYVDPETTIEVVEPHAYDH